MKLKSIKAKNFMSFEDIELDFATLNGLVMIEGWNHDDNSASGAGKTALIDIISFILTGESPRNLKANEFINDQSKKGCEVTGTLEMDDGRQLVIKRTRKPEDLYFQIGDGAAQRDTNLIKTQKLLEDFLKIDFNTFINSVYFARNANSKFISAKDTEKRDILTRILDLSEFDKAYDIAKDKISELNIELRTVTSSREVVMGAIKIIDNDIKSTQALSDHFEAERTAEVRRKTIEANKELMGIRVMEQEIETAKKTKLEVVPFDGVAPDASSFKEERETLLKTINLKEKVEDNKSKVDMAYTTITVNINNAKKAISDMHNLGKGQCTRCKQFINEQHVKEEIQQLTYQIDKLEEGKKQVEVKREAVNALIVKIKDAERRFKNIEIEVLQAQSDYNKKLMDYQKLVNGVEAEKQRIEYYIQTATSSIEDAKKRNKELLAEVDVISKRQNGYQGLVDEKQKQLVSETSKMGIFDIELMKLNQNIEALEILKNSYKNIKYYIFESTIDELNSRVNKYLDPLFSEDVRIEYHYLSGKDNDKLKFDTKILKNGIEKSYESLSDGEKRRAELATNFALSDIVAMRKSNSLNLMILDEVFDGLDDNCRERVVELLEVLRNDKETILIIDHFNSVQQMIDNKVRVEKKDGVSAIA